MKAHKKTKLFRHFMTILNMLALAVPMLVLGFHALNDSLPKFFASQSVQHHGGESDVFSDDLDYANEQLKTRSLDDNLILTMDSMNYMNYDVQNNPTTIEYTYQTNDIVDLSTDFVSGNIYRFIVHVPSNANSTFSIYLGNFLLIDYIFNYYVQYSQSVNYNLATTSFCDYRLVYANGSFRIEVLSNNNSQGSIYKTVSNDRYYDFVLFMVSSSIDLNAFEYTYVDDSNLVSISRCPYSKIPYTITSTPTTDVTSLDDWKTYYNNKNYAQIIDTGVNTHLPINVDFVSLFTQSDIINHDGNIATLLFINFYCNWILNISLIIFFPQVIMCFINWAIDLIYKFTDVKGD